MYLRILRTKHLHGAKVIGSCLKGLSKFSTLVNLELLVEILGELKDVTENYLKCDNPEMTMLSLVCVFHLLNSPGAKALTIDVSWAAEALKGGVPLLLLQSSNSNSSPSQNTNSNSNNKQQLYLPNAIDSAVDCVHVFTRDDLPDLAQLTEKLFHMTACVGSSDNGTNSILMEQAVRLLSKHHSLAHMLDREGCFFQNCGGSMGSISGPLHIVQSPVTLYYILGMLTHLMPIPGGSTSSASATSASSSSTQQISVHARNLLDHRESAKGIHLQHVASIPSSRQKRLRDETTFGDNTDTTTTSYDEILAELHRLKKKRKTEKPSSNATRLNIPHIKSERMIRLLLKS